MADATTEPVLADFRKAVAAVYGKDLSRVVLFGSRARGDHRPDSDYDVAVFIEHFSTLWRELDKIQPIAMAILDDSGALISAKPLPAAAYLDHTTFMSELRRDGIEI